MKNDHIHGSEMASAGILPCTRLLERPNHNFELRVISWSLGQFSMFIRGCPSVCWIFSGCFAIQFVASTISIASGAMQDLYLEFCRVKNVFSIEEEQMFCRLAEVLKFHCSIPTVLMSKSCCANQPRS